MDHSPVGAGSLSDIEKRLAPLNPADKTVNAEFPAMRAMALHNLGRLEEIKPIAEALVSRNNSDHRSVAWGMFLKTLATRPLDAKAAIDSTKLLQSFIGQQPVITYVLGQFYAAAEDYDSAQRQWQRTLVAAPYWALPIMQLSWVSAAGGNLEVAFVFAQAAYERLPQDRDVAVNFARIWSAALQKGSNPPKFDRAAFTDYMAKICKIFPNDEDLLPVQVQAALASTPPDPELAKRLINEALNSKRELREQTLLQLAGLSQVGKLGLEQACFDASEKIHNLTANSCYARALAARFETGRMKAGNIWRTIAPNIPRISTGKWSGRSIWTSPAIRRPRRSGSRWHRIIPSRFFSNESHWKHNASRRTTPSSAPRSSGWKARLARKTPVCVSAGPNGFWMGNLPISN